MYIANADFQKHESGEFAQWTWFILYKDTTHFYNYIVEEEQKQIGPDLRVVRALRQTDNLWICLLVQMDNTAEQESTTHFVCVCLFKHSRASVPFSAVPSAFYRQD